ncbi:Tetraspanin-2 [Asimina triloba]
MQGIWVDGYGHGGAKGSRRWGGAMGDQQPPTHTHSGCCKPPTVCGYTYVNPMVWTAPTNPAADADCSLWSNDPSQYCYACSSCKAGLLGNLRKEWRRANVILIITLVVLIWVYLIACSAFKNAQTEDLFSRYKRGYV